VVAKGLSTWGGARARHDDGHDGLTPLRVLDADDGDLADYIRRLNHGVTASGPHT
jgi:hypothetical protein